MHRTLGLYATDVYLSIMVACFSRSDISQHALRCASSRLTLHCTYIPNVWAFDLLSRLDSPNVWPSVDAVELGVPLMLVRQVDKPSVQVFYPMGSVASPRKRYHTETVMDCSLSPTSLAPRRDREGRGRGGGKLLARLSASVSAGHLSPSSLQ
ncbi:hypothetical protein LZ32DRAFT_114628 [Colletotrichum eremochloae]|nr:hypothetical protein LZ32DRAFT_114628 [Colletotrichum eremochloae]